MNLLVLLNRIPFPLNDGGAIGTLNFVKGYAEAGCNVTILAMNTSKHFVSLDNIQVALGKYGKVHTVEIDNNIKPVPALLNLFSSESYIIKRFVSQSFQAKLIELLSGNKFVVVHLDGLQTAAYIDVIRRHSSAKIAMRAHNVEHKIWQRVYENEKNFIKKLYVKIQSERLRAFEKKAIAELDVTLAISKEDEEALLLLSPGANAIVVPAGMDIDERAPVVSSTNNLFFIGSFDWMPNLQGIEWFFENIWKSVVVNFPSIKFFIAGKKMPESVRKLQTENVVPVGEVSDAKEFVVSNDIMIVPIVSGSGIRIKILEGMALGKPVIATTIAAEGLGLTHNENILIANTAPEFIESIGRCINDFSFREKIALNAHSFALENFQNKRIFEKLIRYYHSLI
jgi:glycosyltransferase involved in cell wall biosynthesis